MHARAGAQSLILMLAVRGGAADDGGAGTSPPVPPRVAREATMFLLKAAWALHDNNHLLVRSRLLMPSVHCYIGLEQFSIASK